MSLLCLCYVLLLLLFCRFLIIYDLSECFKVPRDYDLLDDEAKKLQKQEQGKIDNAVPLSEEEIREKDELLSQVTNSNFNQLCRILNII